MALVYQRPSLLPQLDNPPVQGPPKNSAEYLSPLLVPKEKTLKLKIDMRHFDQPVVGVRCGWGEQDPSSHCWPSSVAKTLQCQSTKIKALQSPEDLSLRKKPLWARNYGGSSNVTLPKLSGEAVGNFNNTINNDNFLKNWINHVRGKTELATLFL